MRIQSYDQFGSLFPFDLIIRRYKDDDGDVQEEPLTVRLNPVPLGFRAEMVRRLPDPVAPIRVLRDEQQRVMRWPDDAGPDLAGKPVQGRDENNPSFLARKTENDTLRVLAMAYEGTREAGDIEWEVEPPAEDAKPEDWRVFYQALVEGVTKSRLPMGRVMKLSAKVAELSGISADGIEEIGDAFFGEEAPTA